MGSLPMNPSTYRDRVYIAAMPLRATKGPAQLLFSAAYSLNVWHLQHFMLILKPAPSDSQGLVFDFQPQDPENIFVALAALSGRPVPGTILTRKIAKLPRKRCWYVGLSKLDNGVEAAFEFSGNWPTDLRIGKHDCRHYTNGLAEVLTGEKNVLERLKINHAS
ncbi:hypothetical protein RND81_14G007200 [Saponaria officinalis]|uniref:Uncharacterized protein n=1 Tax=Saponaria officinalis TaxID=3572 RepID=A0AAW1GGW2_SAPOF